MKHAIPCAIDTIASPAEEAWIITIGHAAVSNAIILLTALRLGKLSQIRLTDRRRTALLRSDRLELGDTAARVNAAWLDAVCAMLVNIHLNGWTDTAHLDEDLPAPGREICVCVAVAPPKN